MGDNVGTNVGLVGFPLFGRSVVGFDVGMAEVGFTVDGLDVVGLLVGKVDGLAVGNLEETNDGLMVVLKDGLFVGAALDLTDGTFITDRIKFTSQVVRNFYFSWRRRRF